MNYLTELLNHLNAGYIYGTSVAITQKNFVNKMKESPYSTTINVLTTSALYGFASTITSKYILKGKENMVLSAVLLGVSAYNVYHAIKINKKDKKDETDEDMRSKIHCECKTDCYIEHKPEDEMVNETEDENATENDMDTVD